MNNYFENPVKAFCFFSPTKINKITSQSIKQSLNENTFTLSSKIANINVSEEDDYYFNLDYEDIITIYPNLYYDIFHDLNEWKFDEEKEILLGAFLILNDGKIVRAYANANNYLFYKAKCKLLYKDNDIIRIEINFKTKIRYRHLEYKEKEYIDITGGVGYNKEIVIDIKELQKI